MSQSNAQRLYDRREEWRSHRRLGDPSATFAPGEELRCPGTLKYPNQSGEVCGGSWSEYANPHTRVIIRVRATLRRSDDLHAGTFLRCHKCGTALEKLTILEASE